MIDTPIHTKIRVHANYAFALIELAKLPEIQAHPEDVKFFHMVARKSARRARQLRKAIGSSF